MTESTVIDNCNKSESQARDELRIKSVRRKNHTDKLPFDISDIRKRIVNSYRLLYSIQAEGDEITPSALRILDSFYTVEKTMEGLSSLSKDKRLKQRLPVFADGKRDGFLRIYIIAKRYFECRDYSFSKESIKQFIASLELSQPIDSKELSLLPNMLKINAIQLILSIMTDAENKMRSKRIADEYWRAISRHSGKYHKEKIITQSAEELDSVGINHLYTLMCENDEIRMSERLKDELESLGKSIEKEYRSEDEKQSRLYALSVNVINSIRSIDSLDWEVILYDLSPAYEIMSRDYTFCRMDTASKRHYTEVVTELSEKLNVSEATVAAKAYELCKGKQEKQSHIGYWLITREGRAELEKSIRPERKIKLYSTNKKLLMLIIPQLVITIIISAFCFIDGFFQGALAILPAAAIANAVVIKLFGSFGKQSFIPRMEIESNLICNDEKSITPSGGTVVAVPMLICSEDDVKSAIDNLEAHYLSNRLDSCVFILLGDFPDSNAQWNEGEIELLEKQRQGIKKLNKKYAKPNKSIFYAMHRERRLSKSDGIWLGHERKRGAVMDFLRLVTTDNPDIAEDAMSNYALVTDVLPSGLKYCMVLDSDTVLPRETLKEMIGAMEHPLNKPETDKYGMVKSGYGIIVPRMESTASGAAKTHFTRLISGFGGVSSYSVMTRNFNQDYFEEGIFGGKGIFDMKVFYNALDCRIRDNTVLSHDLLEGCFTRAGYMSDVVLYDSEPKTVCAWWKRQHRWIRGDWQLLPYLFNKVKDESGSKHKNLLSPLSKYKIFDNLRRSLTVYAVMNALYSFIFFGFGGYFVVGLIALFLEPFLSLIPALKTKGAALDVRFPIMRAILDLAILPYEALVVFDAVWRTLYRLLISHKKLLQWQTSAQSDKKSGGLISYFVKLFICPVFGIIVLLSPIVGLFGLAPLGVLWIISPVLCYWTDMQPSSPSVNESEKKYLKDIAKKQWQFFLDYGDKAFGYTPPDNVQIEPYCPAVKNTSPTNIGMGIMATVSAYDMGLIDDETLLERLNQAVSYINSLEKWNGHLFNWYETETGEKLKPAYISTVDSGNLIACLMLAAQALYEHGGDDYKACGDELRKIAFNTDMSALYDSERNLFHIGFDYSNGALSKSWYDLLASEARLSYLVACAMDMVPIKAWQSLGRMMIGYGGKRNLISWGGTMFEYLMPAIFSEQIKGTLIEEACKSAVASQIHYAKQELNDCPWGISESGYLAFDERMYYQYRAFGVPRLGLSPMREHECVIAPYASMLALMIDPKNAIKNLERLSEMGASGKYGFYEAVDYTSGDCNIVKSYMAHHQGMSICSINNIVNGGILGKRFASIPEIRAVRMLEEEMKPSNGITLKEYKRAIYAEEKQSRQESGAYYLSEFHEMPEGQLLTNGRYTVFIADNGVGFSKYNDVLINAFSPDYLRGEVGVDILIRTKSKVFSIFPALNENKDSIGATVFENHRVELNKAVENITLKAEICVAPNKNGEIRKITIINHGENEEGIELGVYVNIACAGEGEFFAHPSFARLKVEAEKDGNTIIFKRRGTNSVKPYYVYSELSGIERVDYCCDRGIMPGRLTSKSDAMKKPIIPDKPISTGTEPCVFARSSIKIKPGESVVYKYVMGISDTREGAKADCSELVNSEFNSVCELSKALLSGKHKFLTLSPYKARLFERLAAWVILKEPFKEVQCRSSLSEKELFRLGLNANDSIVLVEIKNHARLRIIKTLMQFAVYMKQRGVDFKLCIIGGYANEYRNDLKTKLLDMLSVLEMRYGKISAIKIIDGYSLSEDDKALLYNAALAVIDSNRSIDKQLQPRPCRLDNNKAAFVSEYEKPSRENLLFYNGIGGFDEITGEYVISTEDSGKLLKPYSNIICSPSGNIGTLVTESGGGYTWSKNAHENRLTPWYNNAISDKQNEIIIIRDDETGEIGQTVHGRLNSIASVSHGYGYSVYKTASMGIKRECTIFVDSKLPIKYQLLKIKNTSSRLRRISVSYMVDWDINPGQGVIEELGELCAIGSIKDKLKRVMTAVCDCDRRFGFDRERILNRFGDISEDCDKSDGNFSAVKCNLQLNKGEETEILFVMGLANDDELNAIKAIDISHAKQQLELIKSEWESKLGAINIKTPDTAFDTLVNKRLLYQVYNSRLIGRTGYYQSGGAVGFRDQLQDVLALLYTDSKRAREQIIQSASKQFEQGDVLHWWHEPNRGVRTTITDDRLFLPFVTAWYCRVTGDYDILNEKISFLKDVSIPSDKRDIYFEAEGNNASAASLYEHCLRAVKSCMRYGKHGLPLMGQSDWNDGMDNVGQGGGESVFLAFFMIRVMTDLKELSRKRDDKNTYATLSTEIKRIKAAIEDNAWDGDWYKRAYYSDGEPLGSRLNRECSIDLLSQVWAVMSGSSSKRARKGFESAMELLKSDTEGIIKLLTPAFNGADEKHSPGYIEGYLPGVRENGGQYTHAAVWAVIAACMLGSDELAVRLMSMLNPINHTMTPDQAARYMGEPYVMAGDVYSGGELSGRAGWTWYTGSAALAYVAAVRFICGIVKEGDRLYVRPHNGWGEYSFDYRFKGAVYHIKVVASDRECILENGAEVALDYIELRDGGGDRFFTVMRKVR